MKSFKQILETVYRPKSGDEQAFLDKHVVSVLAHPHATELQFKADAKTPKAKRKADYDEKEDQKVYEAAEVHTKRADKEPVIVRSVDPKTGQSKAKTVMRRAGEIKIGEEVELDEKVDNAYAVGMSAAMKKAGDTPPLKKSTIVKGHEIAKSIMKKEAMDPVGKADADIDNDGDVDKSDKYLHARRKAIGKALRKEEVEELDELKKSTLGSYVKKSADDLTHIQRDITSGSVKDPEYKGLSRMRKNRKAGIARAVTSLTKEEAELDEARKSDSYQFTHKPGDAESEKRLADLKKSVKGTGKRVVLQGRLGKDNPNAHKYSKDAPWGKYKDGKRVNSDVSGKSGGHSHQRIQKADAAHHDVYVYNRNESVELDELKKSTLASYIKKATPDAMDQGVKGMDFKNENRPKHFNKAMGRMMGIKKAADKLAKEEVENLDELKKSTLGSYVKKASTNQIGNTAAVLANKNDSETDRARKRMGNRMSGIAKATDRLTKEEVELDEVSKSTLGRYVKAASTDAARKTSEKDSVDRDYPNRSFSDRLGYKKELGKKLNRRRVGISKAVDRLTKEEVEQIDEAFKIGAMKLKDGSSVTLTRESVDALNGLFSQLNSANKSKMEERMMSGKKGFQEILSFAENV
jgi:hypothetical protein